MSRSFIEVNQSLVQQPEWMVLYSTISIQMIMRSDFNTLEYKQLIEYVEWQQRMVVYVSMLDNDWSILLVFQSIPIEQWVYHVILLPTIQSCFLYSSIVNEINIIPWMNKLSYLELIELWFDSYSNILHWSQPLDL